MENKTTTELLDLIQKLENTPEEKEKDNHWDLYQDAVAELRKRTPFKEILGTREDNEQSLEERIEELEESVKLLKRHKHDVNNGDVLIRI